MILERGGLKAAPKNAYGAALGLTIFLQKGTTMVSDNAAGAKCIA